MAPVEKKEYFYQWPYTVFGDTFDDVLILGAGTGTDVAAALRHGAKHVDAVEIDPVILRLGAARHPDRPYSDPRVTVDQRRCAPFSGDDGPRSTTSIVFALIDSLTRAVELLGRAARELHVHRGIVPRRARSSEAARRDGALQLLPRDSGWSTGSPTRSAAAFGHDPLVHVHQERAYLGGHAGGAARSRELAAPPRVPSLALAYGQSHEPSPARALLRDPSVEPATDDWPFLYMRERPTPRHYLAALAVGPRGVGSSRVSALGVSPTARIRNPQSALVLAFLPSGAGFMLLETKSIVQFALLWGSTWSSASLAIASVLVMALASVAIASRVRLRRRVAARGHVAGTARS